VEEVKKDGNVAPPPKKRWVWHAGTERIRVDLLCASAVTMAGAHLAEWGKGEEPYERAADLFNQQPAKPFHVDGKAVKDRFKLLKAKFEKKEAAVAKESGTVEEVTEMDALMADACSAMNDSRLRAAKAKGETTKKENALLQAGADARRSALARRVRRREERDAGVAADGDGEEKREGGEDGGGTTRSPAAGRSRRRAEIEDEKEEKLLEVVRSSAESSRKAEERRCSAEERRLDLEERKLQHEREAYLAEARRQEAREATSRRAAADALAAAAADREERARSLDLIAALVRRLDK